MYSKTVYITPAEARDWLDTKNHRNRPVSERTVNRYAQEMKAGRWKLNGEAIIFGKSGNLLNGQHRLKACVQSGRDFQTVITYGVEDSTFDTLDDVHPRKLSDVLSINGERNASFLSSGLSFVYQYATGQIISRGGGSTKNIATKQLLEKMLVNHPRIRDSARYYKVLRSRPGGVLLPPALCVGLHYIFTMVEEDKAHIFFEQFQSGILLDVGNPIYLLRQRLIAGGRETSSKIRTEAQYAYTVMAWNAFVGDGVLKRLVYNGGDVLPEIAGVPKSLMRDLL